MNIKVDISNVVLHTDRLTLRPWTLNDLDDFYNYASVPGVGEMAGWAHHESRTNSLEILNMFINEKKTFAIEFNGRVIGSLGIEKYNEEHFPEYKDLRVCEIGFVLSKSFWGNGLMPEAVRAVIKYLFDEIKIDVITCGHFTFNNQSKKVQEKCGFKFVKKVNYHTRDGRDIECLASTLTREDYYGN